ASSREAVQAHLDRIAAVNPAVNAVTSVLADRALQIAAEADRRLAAGEDVGPLHGVPFSVKENVDLAGSATTQGVAAMAGAVPAEDAPQVAHLRAGGAIAFARTNLPDFALRWHTDNAIHGAGGGGAGGRGGRPAPGRPGDRPPLPRGPVPGRGGGDRSRLRGADANRPALTVLSDPPPAFGRLPGGGRGIGVSGRPRCR
ncbi:MAG TPA: amidase family protein, partial [Candidatus Dormibacteraeota bacterium]